MINTNDNEFTPLIAPDESYIIFTRWDSRNRKSILHISFKLRDGSWAEPANMGEEMNLGTDNICPKLSPDGKYLFFLIDLRMYWIQANIIEELRLKIS